MEFAWLTPVAIPAPLTGADNHCAVVALAFDTTLVRPTSYQVVPPSSEVWRTADVPPPTVDAVNFTTTLSVSCGTRNESARPPAVEEGPVKTLVCVSLKMTFVGNLIAIFFIYSFVSTICFGCFKRFTVHLYLPFRPPNIFVAALVARLLFFALLASLSAALLASINLFMCAFRSSFLSLCLFADTTAFNLRLWLLLAGCLVPGRLSPLLYPVPLGI
jgi:hypothetical protein